jgi:hypothetical protein
LDADADIDDHRLAWQPERARQVKEIAMDRIPDRPAGGLGVIFAPKIGAHAEFHRELSFCHVLFVSLW